jgi:hypothetical protein
MSLISVPMFVQNINLVVGELKLVYLIVVSGFAYVTVKA